MVNQRPRRLTAARDIPRAMVRGLLKGIAMSESNTIEKPFDVVGFIMEFENGELDKDEVVAGFQHLIDSGTVWSLQGCYSRLAHRLIEDGLCVING